MPALKAANLISRESIAAFIDAAKADELSGIYMHTVGKMLEEADIIKSETQESLHLFFAFKAMQRSFQITRAANSPTATKQALRMTEYFALQCGVSMAEEEGFVGSPALNALNTTAKELDNLHHKARPVVAAEHAPQSA